MERIYSTEQLIQILAQERRACMSGKRLDLAAQPSGINPLIDRFIEPSGIQKFSAYDNFRQTIHQYQHEHQVSGLIWPEMTIGDASLRFPQVDEELISLPQDLRILRAAKSSILSFWQQVTQTMSLFLSVQRGTGFTVTDAAGIEHILARTEWATIAHHGRDQNLELILQLGWGKPEAAKYRRGFPESGSEFVHAVFPGRQPLG
jgi:hypothetical protein